VPSTPTVRCCSKTPARRTTTCHPDTTVTNQLSNAYADEGSAANDCYNAGTTNAKLLARSARERAQADALLAQALERVQSITGTTISTTTTTDPGSGSIFG